MSRTSVRERGVVARGLALLGLAVFARAAPPAALEPLRRRGHALPAGGGRDRLHRRHHGHPRRPDRGRRRHPDQARRFDGDRDHRGGRQVVLLGHRARQLPRRRGPRHPAQGFRAAPAGRGGLRGPDGALKVDNVELGKSYGATLTVRAADFDDTTSKWDEFLQSSVNGLRLGLLLALASRRPLA